MIERLPTPVGPRPARRRPGSSEPEDGLARVRADRGAARASVSSATSRSGETSRTKSSTRLRRGRLRRGVAGRPSARDPGEDLPGSWAATELVAWYNGHPDFQELAFDLSGERAVVVGNGNVALDVARMLALTREELAPTDTTDAAIEAIVGSGLREIHVLGRRGPVQAAWTSTELQEMGELAGQAYTSTLPSSSSIPRAKPSLQRAATSFGGTSRSCATSPCARRRPPRTIRLRFRVSPVAILGEERVEAVEIAKNRLEPDGKGSVRAVATDEREVIPCELVFRSVGYRGVALPGVPFDVERGRRRTRRGACSTSRAHRFQACTWRVGSSAVRRA